MDESLRTARSTHQILLGLSGIYLLGRLSFASGGDAVSGVNFLGFKFGNEVAFCAVIVAAYLLTSLRLCVLLHHIRLLPKGEEEYSLLKTFAWVLLFDNKRKLAALLKGVEFCAILLIGYDCVAALHVVIPVLAVACGTVFTFLLLYGIWQLGQINEDVHRWAERERNW